MHVGAPLSSSVKHGVNENYENGTLTLTHGNIFIIYSQSCAIFTLTLYSTSNTNAYEWSTVALRIIMGHSTYSAATKCQNWNQSTIQIQMINEWKIFETKLFHWATVRWINYSFVFELILSNSNLITIWLNRCNETWIPV